MLKKAASGVLASLRGSTYRSVRLTSSLAAVLLDSLFEHPKITDLFLNFHLVHEIGGFTEAGGWNITILLVMQDHSFPHYLC